MAAPQAILDLVARFTEHRDAYLSPGYNEAQLRQEFLDPMFEALGWDMANRQGHAEAYKEVIHEDAIKIGSLTKAPDYSFRVGGVRKFFLEAKKPSRNLKEDPEPAYQLRRYAWSAKLPLSVLTDFEEFAVYDCRIRPASGDKAAVGRTRYLKYTDYATRWEEIAGVFSRDAVLKGSFDKYAESGKKKRGTAEVDVAFLGDIERWRELLAKNFAARNDTLEQQDLNFAVQRTIDRIIFLRIAEDRGLETYGQLQALGNGTQTYARLRDLFRAADARYNSGLFHFHAEKDRHEAPDELTLGLKLDDKPLKEIIAGLYYPESPYEFSVLSADILGQVYEQFLGKVIRLTAGHQAKVEEKPEVKKAGGVYYTPTYIVDYIVRQTVGRLLEGKTPKEADRLTVLDPACGSGSFLIGAYQHILDWYRDQYAAAPDKHRKQLFQGPGGAWRLTSAERKRILLNNIYGVDIDPQAVEVTKLSLLLKVLEGENAESLQHELHAFRQRALPDLGDNIKCGNSLIDFDYFSDELLEAETAELSRINPFSWREWARDIAGREVGVEAFHAVIGNPPYGADYSPRDKAYFQAHYSYEKGKPETYIFFLEKSFRLLAKGGMLGVITPNAWLTNFYGAQIRRYLLEHGRFRTIADLERVKVFKSATVDTAITVVSKDDPRETPRQVVIMRPLSGEDFVETSVASQTDWLLDKEAVINTQLNTGEQGLLHRIESSGRKLSEFAEYSQGVIPYLTKEEGLRNQFIRSKAGGSDWLPLLESAGQVRPYEVDEHNSFIKYGSWLNRSRERRFFSQPKILFHRLRKKLPRQLVGGIELTGAVNRHALSNLILRLGFSPETLWALLTVFNSHVVNWWFAKRFGLLMEVGGFKVGTIPIPADFENHVSWLSKQAREITDARRTARGAKTSQQRALLLRTAVQREAEVERHIAKLYHLTPAEIRLIEEATA